MTTYDTFFRNYVFVTPDHVPSVEQVCWRNESPEARVEIVAQTDGYLRFEVYPSSGAPALKQVAPALTPGCHWLLTVRHQNGKTRIRLAEVGYGGQSEREEIPYDFDQARQLIANLFRDK
jgi:hypothetical protein